MFSGGVKKPMASNGLMWQMIAVMHATTGRILSTKKLLIRRVTSLWDPNMILKHDF